MGGRLRLFYHKWRDITSDPFILEAVRGYKIEFNQVTQTLQGTKPFILHKRNKSEAEIISKEIAKLLDKEVIEPCARQQGDFL